MSFYYCFDDAGSSSSVLAEVTNTPWGERHAYLLAAQPDGDPVLAAASPRSCTCRRSWAWITSMTRRAAAPGETLSVHIESPRSGDTAFDATLAMRRRGADPVVGWRG